MRHGDMLRRPLVWGLLYLLLIPLFAGVYLGLPARSFHQPLLPLEPGWVDADGKRLRTHLRQAINPHRLATKFRVECGYHLTSLDVARVEAVDRKARFAVEARFDTDGDEDWDDIAWFSVELDPFDVFGHSRRQTDGRITQAFLVWKVETERVLEPVGEDARPVRAEWGLRCADGQPDPKPRPDWTVYGSHPPMDWLFPRYVDSESNVDELGQLAPPWPGTGGLNQGVVRFEHGAAQDLRKYIDAISGDPKSASGAGLRMLYLSVVTVTTLGLGDITPLTTAARVAVGAESVLGIIFIGLFLNAIASRERPGEGLTTSSEDDSDPAPRDPPEPGDGVAREPINDDAPDQ